MFKSISKVNFGIVSDSSALLNAAVSDGNTKKLNKETLTRSRLDLGVHSYGRLRVAARSGQAKLSSIATRQMLGPPSL